MPLSRFDYGNDFLDDFSEAARLGPPVLDRVARLKEKIKTLTTGGSHARKAAEESIGNDIASLHGLMERTDVHWQSAKVNAHSLAGQAAQGDSEALVALAEELKEVSSRAAEAHA